MVSTRRKSERLRVAAPTTSNCAPPRKGKGKAKAVVMGAQKTGKLQSSRRQYRSATATSESDSEVNAGDSKPSGSRLAEMCEDPSQCDCRRCAETRYTWTLVAADIESQGLTPDDGAKLWSVCPSEALWLRCMKLSQDLRYVRFLGGLDETEIGIVTKLAFGFEETRKLRGPCTIERSI